MCSDAKCVRRVIERPFTFSPPAVVPGCSFSHLVLFSAQIGDAWAIIALCSGRVTTGAEPWPAWSLVFVSLAVKYTPNGRHERQHSSGHDGCYHVHGSTFEMRFITAQPFDANNFSLRTISRARGCMVND